MQARNLFKVAIFTFTVLALCSAEVTDLKGDKQGKIFIQKGLKVEIDLKKMFDVSSVQYPLTVTSTPESQLHDLTHSVSRIRHKGDLDLDFTATTRVNQSKVIMFIKNELKVCELTFSDVELVHNDLSCLAFDSGQLAQAPEKTSWECEDAVYESSLSGYFVVCRGTKTTVEQKVDRQIAVVFKSEEGVVTTEKFFQNEFVIKNRAKLVVFKNTDAAIKDIDYFNLITDTFTENGKDQEIELKVRLTSLFQFGSGDIGEFEVQDNLSAIQSPREFFSFGNKLLLVSKRTDSQGKLCFTEIKYKFSAQKEDVRFWVGEKFHCSEQTTGYLGLSHGSHVSSFEPSSKLLKIFAVKLNFYTKKNWMLTDNYDQYDLKDSLFDGAVREVEFTSHGAVVKFCKDQGIHDNHNTLAFPSQSSTPFIFESKPLTSGTIINSYFVQIDNQYTEVFNLSDAYLKFDTSSLSFAENPVTVSAYDASQSESQKVTHNFSITLVQNPLAEIELKFDEQELLPIHATKGSEIVHNLHSSSIVRGNFLNFEVKYTSEKGRQFLKSDCAEYSNYEVEYSGFSSQAKPV